MELLTISSWRFLRDGQSILVWSSQRWVWRPDGDEVRPSSMEHARLEKAIKFNRSPEIFPQAATGPCSFGTRRVKRRIYATPWDGNIVITAKLDGTMTTAINQ